MLTKQTIAAFGALGVSALVLGMSAVGPVSAQTPNHATAVKAAGNARHEAAADKEEAYRKHGAVVKAAGIARHEAAADKEEAYRKRGAAVKTAALARRAAAADKEAIYQKRLAAEKAAKGHKH